MSARRTHTYHAGRSRREIVTAVAVGLAILVVTAALVWVLAPDTTTTTPVVPAADTPAASVTPGTATTVAPATADTTTPGG